MTTLHPISDAPVPPSVSVLRSLLICRPETGDLIWKDRGPEWFPCDDRIGPSGRSKIWNARYAGQPAFLTNRQGYLVGELFGRAYAAHRVIWAMTHGAWPVQFIDHINGDKRDNRIRNLREATRTENCRNAKIRVDNSSGYKGVSWDAAHSKWKARIGHQGKIIQLGRFESPEAAYAAYCAAASEYHKNFARLA